MLDTQTEFPSDMCVCGRDASEAFGDPLLDHEPTCEVYLQEARKLRDQARNQTR